MAVTKRPVLNLVVALLILASIVALCLPCWSFTVIDAVTPVLNKDGTISVNIAGGEALTDDNNDLFFLPKRINGTGVKESNGIIIDTKKVPIGGPVGEFTIESVEGELVTLNGKNAKINDKGVLTVDGKVFTTTVTPPPAKDPVTGKASSAVQISDDLYLNTYGDIVNSKGKSTIFVPVVREEKTSVMGYIAFPNHRAGQLVTVELEGAYEGFILNGQVWFPIILFFLGIASIVVLLFVKRNTTHGLIMPIVYSILGIILVWINQLTRFGGLATTLLPSLLMLATALVAAYNGNWFDTEGDWRRDPSAAGKIKEIKAAVGKKNLDLLKSYVQSSDPEIRIAALDAIARVGGFNAFHPIVGQLSSANADVRIAAAEALVTLGDSRGRTYLMHFMEEDPSPEVREAMSAALSKLPSLGN